MSSHAAYCPEPLSAVLWETARHFRRMAKVYAARARAAEALEQTPPDEDPNLDVAAIARELAVAPSTARQLCATGEIKAARVGKGYRARLSAVRSYERRRLARA